MKDNMQPEDVKQNRYLSLVPILIAVPLAALLIPCIFGGEEIDFANAALKAGTTSIFASVDGNPIHFQRLAEAGPVLQNPARAQASSTVLWIGNSQVHAINQYKPDQENAPPHLFRALRNKGVDLVTFSYPNINLQECYASLEYLRNRMKIDYLILPVVFDDTREDGIGVDFQMIFQDPEAVELMSNTQIGKLLLKNNESAFASQDDYAALQNTTQEKTEKALNQWLDDNWQTWASRKQARGKLIMSLRKLRNTTFGITPQTKRAVIPGRYIMNLQALDAILETASSARIQVLIYIVPIRNDVDIPYILSEYERFKQDVQKTCNTHSAAFANLESLIPSHLWGQKESTTGSDQLELDFMHFQADGHKILAEKLYQLIDEKLLQETPPPSRGN